MFVLTHWKIVPRQTADGSQFMSLCGHVFGNPKFAAGEFVQISAVATHRIQFDSLIVTTVKGSDYWLGKPDPAEPFANQDLMQYLREKRSIQVQADVELQTQPPGFNSLYRAPPELVELLSRASGTPRRRASDSLLTVMGTAAADGGEAPEDAAAGPSRLAA